MWASAIEVVRPDSAKELILRGNLRGLLATVLDAKGR